MVYLKAIKDKLGESMKFIIKQGLKFIGLSGIGWILDFFVYIILGLKFKNLFFNNLISSLVGVTFVFFFSTRIIFQNKSKISLKWKYIIYLCYQCLLIYGISKTLLEVNQLILGNINIEIIRNYSTIISKILITPVTMILNFCVVKNIIEKL